MKFLNLYLSNLYFSLLVTMPLKFFMCEMKILIRVITFVFVGVDVLKKSESLFELYSVCDVFKSMWLCPWWILEVENVKLVKVFFYFCFYFSSITALPSQTHSIGILLRIFHSGRHINQQPSFPVFLESMVTLYMVTYIWNPKELTVYSTQQKSAGGCVGQ